MPRVILSKYLKISLCEMEFRGILNESLWYDRNAGARRHISRRAPANTNLKKQSRK
jgi:hypothetical protein